MGASSDDEERPLVDGVDWNDSEDDQNKNGDDTFEPNERPSSSLATMMVDTKHSTSSPSSPPLQQSQQRLPLEVISYMVIFFMAMVGHELALEAASTEFSNLKALPYAVTLFQFGFCVLIPLGVSKGKAVETFPKSFKQMTPYIALSMVVFGSTGLASMSLQYVSHPTKVVFKSAKLIPTMIVSTLLHQGSKYGLRDYIAALLLCAGAAGYSFGQKSSNGNHDSYPGIILLAISVLCDALVPNLQQKLMTSTTTAISLPQQQTSNNNGTSSTTTTTTTTTSTTVGLSASALMVNVNVVGFTGLLCYMAVCGHLLQSIKTILIHPRLLCYLTLVGLGLGTAVLAYTRLIRCSGSVVAVSVATLRKVATVILSYIVFPKTMLPIHIVSGFAVLAGILLSTFGKNKQKK